MRTSPRIDGVDSAGHRPNLNQIVASYVRPSLGTRFGCPLCPCDVAGSNFVPIGAMACRNDKSPAGNATCVVLGSNPAPLASRGVSTRRNRSFVAETIVIGASRVSSVAQYRFE